MWLTRMAGVIQRFRDGGLRSDTDSWRHSPRAAEDRSWLLFPALQDHPGPHGGGWRCEFLFLRRSSRHPSRAAPRHPGSRMTSAEILAHIPKFSALVVGDICLDRWCTYDPAATEPSRETGHPAHRRGTDGGHGRAPAVRLPIIWRLWEWAAWPCLARSAMTASAFELTRALAARGISSELLVRTPAMQTFTYTKADQCDTGIEDQPAPRLHQHVRCPEVERQILDNLPSVRDELRRDPRSRTRRRPSRAVWSPRRP